MLESLRPPPGYRLNRAIGTTFTLDLISLLTAPLAFTFFDWEDAEGRPSADPLALMQAVREHASRIHLFCQAGEICLPPVNQPLLAYLEDSVVPVHAPRPGGLFHPKVWVLRFTGEADEPVCYRLLCMSRNLTFSRAWDTALVLDGELKARQRAIARNHPVGDFLAALPAMAKRGVSPETKEAVDLMQEEVRRVDFHLPDNFNELTFWPMGHAGPSAWPFRHVEDAPFLVMAPYMESWFVEKLAGTNKVSHLVSRPEALADLSKESRRLVEKAWVLSPGFELDAVEGADESPEQATASSGDLLTGLHAKLFVADDGREARVWTGSANATEAAFSRNVEFLVELVGRRKDCGLASLVGESGDDGLTSLLQPYDLGAPSLVDMDPDQDKLEQFVRKARMTIAEASLTASVSEDEGETFSVVLGVASLPTVGPDVEATIWPVTLGAGTAMNLQASEREIRFGGLSVAAITAFFAVRVRASVGKKSHEEVFVLRVPLHGAPSDRRERILRSLLTDPAQVMRLLLLLLSLEGIRIADFEQAARGNGAGQGLAFGNGTGPTLLESMLRALTENPASLDQVESLILELQQTPEGRELLPVGLSAIWGPIQAARSSMKGMS